MEQSHWNRWSMPKKPASHQPMTNHRAMTPSANHTASLPTKSMSNARCFWWGSKLSRLSCTGPFGFSLARHLPVVVTPHPAGPTPWPHPVSRRGPRHRLPTANTGLVSVRCHARSIDPVSLSSSRTSYPSRPSPLGSRRCIFPRLG